jgi:hypothetical protein
VAVGEEVLAVDRLNRQDNASGGDGSLPDAAAGGRLHDMRRRVADGAVRMREAVRMEVRLLDSGAEEEKHCAQDGEHETCACFRRPLLAHSWHDYRILYSSKMKRMSQRRPAIRGWRDEDGETRV